MVDQTDTSLPWRSRHNIFVHNLCTIALEVGYLLNLLVRSDVMLRMAIRIRSLDRIRRNARSIFHHNVIAEYIHLPVSSW